MTKLYDSEDKRKYALKSYEVPIGESISEEQALEEFEQGLKLLKAMLDSVGNSKETILRNNQYRVDMLKQLMEEEAEE